MISLHSPLEQFEIILLKGYDFFWFYEASFTNATIFLILVVATISLCSVWASMKQSFIPTKIQLLFEMSYLFIVNIVKQQLGTIGLKYVPLFYSIFLLILASNLIGLLPFAFTPTSHLAFTLTLALSCNLALIIIGFKQHGLLFLKLFVPKGGPAWLIPLIVVIEVLSYLLRTLSLSIRLFANMMAGHTLLHILASFIVGFLKAGFLVSAVAPIILVIVVIGLELGIAFLQAYVFTILLCIYLNDSYHPSH